MFPSRQPGAKEWLAARKKLLVKEKKFSRARDQIAEARRALLWEKVEKQYVFDGPAGRVTLADLFCGKSQLITYHFMFGPGWKDGCPHCSFWADHYDSVNLHLGARDTALAVISRAPWKEIRPFKKRMGWRFNWVSSNQNEFNRDLHVAFTPVEVEGKRGFYNYAMGDPLADEREGVSAFYRDGRNILPHLFFLRARHRLDEHDLQLSRSHRQGPR